MIRYVIISPTHNVDLDTSTTNITVLCQDPAGNAFHWEDTREKGKALMFESRGAADLFILTHKLEGAFSYGIMK